MELPEKYVKFIERNQWIFAKTYATTAPHEYLVKDKLSRPDQKLFEEITQFIRDYGYEQRFYKKVFVYFEFEGKKYWTYGDPVEETIILNRAKI